MIQRRPRDDDIKKTIRKWEPFGAGLHIMDVLFKFIDGKTVPAVGLEQIVDAVSFAIPKNRQRREWTRADVGDLQADESIRFETKIAQVGGVFAFYRREREQRVFLQVETGFFLWVRR